MLKGNLVLLLLLFASTCIEAQNGRLTGKVTNEKTEPVAGASIKVAGNGGTATDLEGRFSLSLLPGTTYTLEVSAIGYAAKVIDAVEVKADGANELNIVLGAAAKDLSTVTVTSSRSTARRETVNALLQFQKNTHTVASVISAEAIRRSPDRNTGEVLKRTPGASIQEGRFIVVRGLADRYNQAMLNGILLSSTEPDRKTFAFDIIPAQVIDNIVINKAFVPEYPGEWAGGLIQVNTRDIPVRNFLNIQVGTGFNSQTIGRDFYTDKGGKLDWLGIEDGTRALPDAYTTKSGFDLLSPARKTAIGKSMRNAWAPHAGTAQPNLSFSANGGFATRLRGKALGGTFGLLYNRNNRYLQLQNRSNSLAGGRFSTNYDFSDDRYVQDVSAGALGSLSLQIDPKNRIAVKSIVNINAPQSVTRRSGADFVRDEEVSGTEFTFRQHTFFTTQVTGEHALAQPLRLKWYGAFNILDGYVPDQRRILYSRASGTHDPYRLLLSNTLSQQSGSRIYQNLSDYIYTAGGDLAYQFDLFGGKQTLKGGYLLQIKDRLYDAKLFANYLPLDNPALRQLPADRVFEAENFGDGTGSAFGFDAIKGNTFRYMANTLLNAGFVQLDNQLSPALRVVWGLRAEHYDQLVGSVKKTDPRHVHSVVMDYLPGVNATYKVKGNTNLRLSASQTVIRPELRELSFLNLYDFELNASVQGKPGLLRTKVSNLDLRYEWYPRAGEVFTGGVFYKYFAAPIEQVFNEGSGGASTFTYQNPEKARSYGAEVELRKRLDFVSALQHFTFQANAAYIYSRIVDEGLKIDRPLQGQSPYLLNMSLLYDLEEKGMTATLLLNRVGERIYLVGDLSAGAGSPDIYEAPRTLLDFQLTKKVLGAKGEVRLNVADLLNQQQYFYQNADAEKGFQKPKDAYRFTRKFGTTVGLTFNYTL